MPLSTLSTLSTLCAVRPRRVSVAVACLLAVLAAPVTHAASVSYAGTFVDDDALYSLSLSFAFANTLSAHTLSYGGGLNSLGALVAAGGFAPVLSLFDATSGLLLQSVAGSATSCGPGTGVVDPASGFCWDAGFSATLAAGDYTLVLSQDGNVPFGPYFGDGYSMAGSPDYTGLAWLGESGRRFINADGTQRDGHWALELNTAAITAIPEPITAGLLLAGLSALAATTRRRHVG